jgi:serine/threonine protein kinase
MAKKKQPWTERWKFVEAFGSGGQGQTSIVRKEDGSKGVLKILNKPNNAGARRRMYLETAALRTLTHAQIPRLLDTNAHEFESDTRLYLVTEFIAGGTLDEVVRERRPTLDEAFGLIRSLCDTLAYAHELNIVHRDISPDNIVLRGSSFTDPVLIDFGISFNAADSGEKATATGEQLRNPFIDVPELKHNGPLQRDRRADVLQAVGVLFYAITGENPVAPLDAKRRHPHQRPEAQQVLEQIEPTRLQVLNRVFDTGFQQDIDDRWQSIQDLRRALEPRDQVAEDSVDPADLKERIEAKLASRDRSRDRATLLDLYPVVIGAIHGVALSAVRAIDSHFRPSKSGSIDWPTWSISYRLGFTHEIDPEISFEARFIARAIGNQLVISVENGDREEELSRVPFESNPNFSDLKARVISLYRNGIYRST